ncbi:thioredoxin family protein [Metamycoplasma canadense]|uniref:Thioredoxin n=1 Tax=Metamycoplasma canadense TaxID=29554 RepID=A0A077LB79_9BACT|nr:thioredoxin family protein [Metamycoplasma canadense]BAP39434.1 thioredoxin [Metamycoplasma canadense]
MYKKLLKNELNNQHLNGKAIVAFRAVWCPPCQMIEPELKRLTEENEDINVFDFDVDQNIEFAREMGVSSIPSLFYYKNGSLINSTKGYMPAEELKKQLEK